MDRAVFARRVLVGGVAKVVGNNQCRHPAFGFRHAHGAIDEMADLGCRAGLLHEGARHVLEHADDIDFLLVMAAKRCTRLLPGDCQDRHVIHPGVVHASDQM